MIIIIIIIITSVANAVGPSVYHIPNWFSPSRTYLVFLNSLWISSGQKKFTLKKIQISATFWIQNLTK
jgi:hypothetical protein